MGNATAQYKPPIIVLGQKSVEVEKIVSSISKNSSIGRMEPRELIPDTMNSPVVYIEHFQAVPEKELLAKRIRHLDNLKTSATYLLFVDTVDDLDWVSSVETPDNLKLAVSVRSMAGPDIKEFFKSIGVEYDPSRARIDYRLAIQMAIAQLDNGSLYGDTFQTKEWTSGKSYAGIFDEIVEPNAEKNQMTTRLVREFIDKYKTKITTTTSADMPILSNLTDDQMLVRRVLALDVLRNGCKTSYPWDRVSENGLDFQSFLTTYEPNVSGSTRAPGSDSLQ